MISKQTVKRIKEIDFETIINSNEPGSLIRHLTLQTQKLTGNKRDHFFAAAAAYYCNLKNIEPTIKELNKEIYLIAWINVCLAESGSETDNLAIMLAGIYQLLKIGKELC